MTMMEKLWKFLSYADPRRSLRIFPNPTSGKPASGDDEDWRRNPQSTPEVITRMKRETLDEYITNSGQLRSMVRYDGHRPMYLNNELNINRFKCISYVKMESIDAELARIQEGIQILSSSQLFLGNEAEYKRILSKTYSSFFNYLCLNLFPFPFFCSCLGNG
jgi:hypothetical protein